MHSAASGPPGRPGAMRAYAARDFELRRFAAPGLDSDQRLLLRHSPPPSKRMQ